jgi:hypothetical protein
MAYLGNTPTQQGFIPAIDFFSGNGSTVAFTLSRPVASVAQVQATIENVPQNPGTAFTVSGNTITFTSAPPSGTNNIYVYYTSPITQVIQPGQNTVGTAQIMPGAVIPADLSTGGPFWNTSSNVGVGTTSPGGSATDRQLTVQGTTSSQITANNGSSFANFGINSSNQSYVEAGGANPLNFFTNGTERMRIDSAGRVTQPFQPTVWLTNPSDVTSTGLFTNWTVQQNVGSHYSGGTFTCPVAGTYFIYLALWRNSGTCDIAIRKNGTNEARVRNATTNDARDSQTVVFNCAANDTIDFTVINVGNILGSSGYSKTLTSAVITLLG